MDTALSERSITKRRRKPFLILIGLLLILAVLSWLLSGFLEPSLKRSSITTAIVEKGNIENTINATGEVLPEFEETITSPINASVQNVILDAGSKVNAGQSVLTLDKSA